VDIALNLGTLLQGLILIVVTLVGRGIVLSNRKLNQINNSIGKLETWAKGHEELDTTRFDEAGKKFETLFELWNSQK